MHDEWEPHVAARRDEIERIIQFIREHPESYASLAVCRRAIDPGLPEIDSQVVSRLEDYLKHAPEEEVTAYYYIIS